MNKIYYQILLFGFLLSGFLYSLYLRHKKNLQNEREYQSALDSGDEEKALILGRKVYARKRGNVFHSNHVVNSADEQAIANDIKFRKKKRDLIY